MILRGDRDWYAVNLVAGTLYRFDLSDTDNSTIESFLQLFNSAGGFISFVGTGSDAQLYFQAPTTGIYYISAGEQSTQTGEYQLSVTDDVTDDHGNLADYATDYVVGDEIAGVTNYVDDEDWFAVSLAAGVYRFDAGNDHSVRVVYSDGIDTGVNDEVVIIDTPAIYYVRVTSSEVGSYTLTSELVVDDFGNSAATAGAYAIGDTVTAVLDYRDDQDWFAIALDVGTYSFNLDGAGFLQFFDADSNFIALGADANGNLVVDVQESGTYYVSVRGGSGDYTLTSAIFDGDDHTNAAAGATLVSVGETISGSIDYGTDVDWFTITLTTGEVYGFTIEALAYLDLVDADGNVLKSTFNFSEMILSTDLDGLNLDGTYYLVVRPSSGNLRDYSIRSTTYFDDAGSTLATAGTYTFGDFQTGTIDYEGDEDWFAVTLEAGKLYEFEVYFDTFAQVNLGNFNFSIQDANGDVIASSNFNGEAQFEVDTDGTYFIAIGGGSEDTYTIQSQELFDDYGNTQAEAAPYTIGDTIPVVIDYTDDTDWFEVTLSAGQLIEISVTEGFLPGDFQVLDQNGNQLVTNDLNGSGAFYATYDGEYYIEVSDGSQPGANPYDLSSAILTDAMRGTTVEDAVALRAAVYLARVNRLRRGF